MSLSVGIVNIDYLEQPSKPISDFLADLAMSLDTDLNDDETWGGGWAENTLVEITQDSLEARARNWCNERHIESSGQAALLAWVADLPWQGGYVMLHIAV